jgi:hypothetical protein
MTRSRPLIFIPRAAQIPLATHSPQGPGIATWSDECCFRDQPRGQSFRMCRVRSEAAPWFTVLRSASDAATARISGCPAKGSARLLRSSGHRWNLGT